MDGHLANLISLEDTGEQLDLPGLPPDLFPDAPVEARPANPSRSRSPGLWLPSMRLVDDIGARITLDDVAEIAQRYRSTASTSACTFSKGASFSIST